MKTAATYRHTNTAWGSRMKNRYFWGTPHTETDALAFEAAMRDRAEDVAAGRFAAAHAVEHSLEQIGRRSGGLLTFNMLAALVLVMLSYKVGSTGTDLFTQFNRWGFALSLVSCVLLLPNLYLVWPGNAASTVRQPHEAYMFALGIHKRRAARYTFALLFTFAAAVLTVLSLTQAG
ncbi:MAG: hypothetical protein Q8K45_12125 [Rubrivivax sp.]|nr:hypothetical protein [Rubrivivax sp.]